MKKINLALIGTGYIADYHVRGLQQIPNTEIISVVSRTKEAAVSFATKYNIASHTNDISTLLSRKDIDAVVIATPNKFHAPYAIEFLKKGIDVFIEKPMAISSQEGRQITKTATENNTLVMIGHMWRFDEEANYIRDTIASDKLGKIFKTKGYGIHVNWGPSGWFVKKELAGGGALADMGVHAIDTARFLLGDPQPKSVYAKIATHFGDYDVDDTGTIFITWDNGTESIIECGWWHPHMDGPEASTGVFGTKGYASLFPTYLEIKEGDQINNITKEFPIRKEHCDQGIYSRQMEHFVASIRNRSIPVPGLNEGQIVLDIVAAAYKSSKTERVVHL